MTTPVDTGAELPRDEHLLAALRHAPDRALTPPSHVTQAILAAAEQVHRAPVPVAVAPAPVRAQPERHVTIAERLQALLAPRWAGSVAAGLVAALVVGLWYEEELPAPVNIERGVAPAQSETQSAPMPARVDPPAPAPAPLQAPAAAQTTTDRPVEARNKAAAAARDEAPKRAAKPEPVAPTIAEAVSPPAATPAAPAATAAKAGASRDDRAADAAAPRAEAGAPTTGDAQRQAEATLAAPSAAARRADASAATVGAMRLAAGPTASAAGAAAASPALTLLRRARADADTRSAIWTWQPGSGATARSFDADAQEWLQRLIYAARGRWVDVAERSDGGTATELRWWRNDEPAAVLRIEAQGLRWTEPSSRIRYAPMTADELARLGPP